jgi:hypothetical protein
LAVPNFGDYRHLRLVRIAPTAHDGQRRHDDEAKVEREFGPRSNCRPSGQFL